MKRFVVGSLSTLGVALFGCGTAPMDSAASPTGAAVRAAAPAEGAAPNDARPGGEATCDIRQYATWESCVGTVVTIVGKDPGPNVMQHPGGADPPEPDHRVDQYMDVPDAGQIVLSVKEVVTCQGAMQATGTLQAVRLGGAPRTKESYSGYRLQNAEVKCL